MPVDKLKETRPSDESNEQIINDLTNNLGSLNTNVENNTKVEDETKNDDEDHEAPSQDDDFIDEVALKDQEINLSESERLQRKADADTAKSRGNDFFKIGEFSKALDEYTLGLRTCPLSYEQERSILYCNRSACKMKMRLTKSALEDCDKAIELNDKYVKAYVRRAQIHEQLEKLDESLEDYKKVLELDPSHAESRAAVHRLPPMINERNEKLKTEMLGKLKDLGNLVLRPFGLSTANFEMKQDSSGGYSINFNQNPKN